MKKQAFNPYLPSWEYIPDGEPHVFGERLYVFGSHDRFNGTLFCQNDYVCWSAPLDDLGNWRFEGTIYRKAQDPLAKEDSIMQAPDVCQGPDGRFYLYYTLGLVPVMAVAVCDTPAGQYQYYGLVQYSNGTPVGTREHDLFQFDPGVFRDDDDCMYLYSGFGPEEDGIFAAACQKYRMNGAYVMELEPDMRTVKGTPRRIVPKNGLAAGTGFEGHGFFEASSMRKIGGRYYFVYSSGLSHELCWAVSDRPDGGFQYGGTLVSIGDIGLTDQPRNYLGNTHGGLVELNGNWYIFYHRQTNRQQYSRQGCAERVELDENGWFHQAEITSCGLNGRPLEGVGTYEARIACNLWSKNGAMAYGHLNTPEAEDHPYFTQTGKDREENEDQYIANMRDGAVAGFKFFDLRGLSEIAVDASDADGEFWVHTALEDAPICKIPLHTGMKCASFPPVSGVKPLYFAYHGKGHTDFYTFQIGG